MFRHGARSFDEMKNVPAAVREFLEQNYRWGGVVEALDETRGENDGAVKFLLALEDGLAIECVLMPSEDYWTLCVSSQVGCPLRCAFCLTGLVGLRRNLDAAEIVDQALWARRYLKERGDPHPLRNLVLMGMGEPLLNADAVIAALRLLIQPDGADFSPRRITVSTVGILPGLEKLGASELGVKLAISLNATDEETRRAIMPISRKYPLAYVLAACRQYPLTQRRRITFEYVLLSGVNDTSEDARRLAELLRGMPCKINLIPFNENPALPFRRPPDERINAFGEYLAARNFTATVRYSKGPDIAAACGQLAGARMGFDNAQENHEDTRTQRKKE